MTTDHTPIREALAGPVTHVQFRAEAVRALLADLDRMREALLAAYLPLADLSAVGECVTAHAERAFDFVCDALGVTDDDYDATSEASAALLNKEASNAEA